MITQEWETRIAPHQLIDPKYVPVTCNYNDSTGRQPSIRVLTFDYDEISPVKVIQIKPAPPPAPASPLVRDLPPELTIALGLQRHRRWRYCPMPLILPASAI